MAVRSSFFRLTVPVDFQELRNVLEKEFPEHGFRVYGVVGKGIEVSKKGSGLTGARIVKALGKYRIRPKPVSPLGKMLYAFTLGAFNTRSSYTLCEQLRTFLVERYG